MPPRPEHEVGPQQLAEVRLRGGRRPGCRAGRPNRPRRRGSGRSDRGSPQVRRPYGTEVDRRRHRPDPLCLHVSRCCDPVGRRTQRPHPPRIVQPRQSSARRSAVSSCTRRSSACVRTPARRSRSFTSWRTWCSSEPCPRATAAVDNWPAPGEHTLATHPVAVGQGPSPRVRSPRGGRSHPRRARPADAAHHVGDERRQLEGGRWSCRCRRLPRPREPGGPTGRR